MKIRHYVDVDGCTLILDEYNWPRLIDFSTAGTVEVDGFAVFFDFPDLANATREIKKMKEGPVKDLFLKILDHYRMAATYL